MARQAFIIGGTGQIGRAVAADLLDRGWGVTLFSRAGRPAPDDLTQRGAITAILDREEPDALAKALAGGADAVIDTVAYTQAHADQLLEVEGDVGAYAVISSASVYRDHQGRSLSDAGEMGFPDFPEPIRETQATVDPGAESYATRKIALETRLLDRAVRPVTIIRPCAIHGRWSTHPREWWFVKRMRDGRPVIPLAYRGLSRFHTSATANIAALIGTALDQPASRIVNSGDPYAPMVTEIGALIGAHLGYRGEIRPLDIGEANGEAAIGGTPWSAPTPFVLDLEASGALGYRPATTYGQVVGEVCDWLLTAVGPDWKISFPILAGYPEDLFDYAEEDRVLASLR